MESFKNIHSNNVFVQGHAIYSWMIQHLMSSHPLTSRPRASFHVIVSRKNNDENQPWNDLNIRILKFAKGRGGDGGLSH